MRTCAEHVLDAPILEQSRQHVACLLNHRRRPRLAAHSRCRVELARRARQPAYRPRPLQYLGDRRPADAIALREALRAKTPHELVLHDGVDAVDGASAPAHALRRAAASAEAVHHRRRHARHTSADAAPSRTGSTSRAPAQPVLSAPRTQPPWPNWRLRRSGRHE